MDEDELIPVSPRHSVRLAEEYLGLVKKAPRRDFVVRTIASREANGLPLVTAEIVIAGEAARTQFPLAATYPLHFKKTYYPGRLHGDPEVEYERQRAAGELVWLPPPIGHTPESFRSCIVPGMPYQRLSPFGAEPEEANLPRARELGMAAAAGLLRLLEDVFQQLSRLHAGGIRHGDAELHNFIVSPSPLGIVPIDFEAAAARADEDDAAWANACSEDFEPLLKELIYLECCLGEQPGPLSELARSQMDQLFKNPKRFRREIGERTNPSA
jgi:hypothetical protein